jgi:hypothetical protein
MEEFNLSEKIKSVSPEDFFVEVKDVKEFIKRLREEMNSIEEHDIPEQTINLSSVFQIIDKLAGETLT